MFDKGKQDQTSEYPKYVHGMLNLSKEDGKANGKESLKNAKMNGRLKKGLNGMRKDVESPYRKVLVTTDLRSGNK